MKTHLLGTSGSSRIPSLDGLRAISIAMVLASHTAVGIPAVAKHPLLLYTIFNGNRGVSVFFVISGFLITSLLLKEEESSGNISLGRFYIRRAFRILPPFWMLLLSLVILWKLGTIQTTWPHLGIAFVFLRDYIWGDWWTGHSWSLSVEEQFYLLWPATLVSVGRRKALWIATSLILAAPVIRVFSHLFITGTTGNLQTLMFHFRLDSLMFGCALAIVSRHAKFRAIVERLLHWQGVLIALVFFLFVSGYLMQKLQGYYMFPFGYSLEGIVISYLLLYFVTKHESVGGKILNSKLLVHIGLISYSLYLWQQVFLHPPLDAPSLWSASLLGRFPLNLIASFVAAEVSYRLVEIPCLAMRHRFEGVGTLNRHLEEMRLMPADGAEHKAERPPLGV